MGLDFITPEIQTWIWIALGAIALIAAIVGFCKGFANEGTWAIELWLTLLIVVPSANAIYNNVYVVDGTEQNLADWTSSLIILALMLIVLIVVSLVMSWNRRIVRKGIENCHAHSYYRNYDQRADNDERIAHAVYTKNEKNYRKYVSKKYSSSSGAWGIYNRVLGAINSIVVALTVVAIILMTLATLCDIFHISLVFNNANTVGVYEFLESLFASEFYKNVIPYVFDVLILSLIVFCVKHGYKKGALQSIWKVVSVVLMVGSTYVAQYLAFNQPLVVDVCKSIEGWIMSLDFAETLNGVIAALNGMGMALTVLDLCQWVMTAILSAVLVLLIWLLSKVVTNLLDKVDASKTFGKFDGAVGVVFYTTLIFAILLFLFGLLYTINDLPFMAKINEYMRFSAIGSRFYQYNPIAPLGWFDFIPLREWLKVIA